MSQVFYRPEGRDSAARFAKVIAHVRRVKSERRTVKTEGIPDFSYGVEILEIIGMLWQSPSRLDDDRPALKPGDIIEVEDAEAGYMYGAHDAYYRLGMSESPILARFDSQGPTGDEFIIYLKQGHFVRFAEYCMGSKDSLSELAAVKKLIEKRS